MDNKRIAWVDDNINTQILKTYIDEFEDNGIEVVKIKTVEGLLDCFHFRTTMNKAAMNILFVATSSCLSCKYL